MKYFYIQIGPFLTFLFLMFFTLNVFETRAQEVYPDTSFKNTIRLNITPLIVTSNIASATLGYERMINDRQSFSINMGHLRTSNLLPESLDKFIQIEQSKKNTGFLVAGDYRFYFSRNKYRAPDGLYWGPYAAYYFIDKQAMVHLNEGETFVGTAEFQAQLSMGHIGFQLGYQFVFWDRWTLDLILFGPGIGLYSGELIMNTNVDINEEEEYLQGAFDAIKALYPAIGSLIKNNELSASGEFAFRTLGYRMVVQIGFRF